MRAGKGRVAVKTGAEGVFAAIVPEAGLGIALKIDDGAGRADVFGLLPFCARARVGKVCKLGKHHDVHIEFWPRLGEFGSDVWNCYDSGRHAGRRFGTIAARISRQS